MADSRIDELRRRLDRDPGSRLFAQLAEEHRKAGDLAEAIRVARAGLEKHPVYPSALLTLGRALLDSGDSAGARQELEQALRQAPDNILASRFLAQALEAQGDLEGALRQYGATLKMAPGDAQLGAHVNELRARSETGRPASQVATGPMPRPTPPPLPPRTDGRVGAVAPTVRLPAEGQPRPSGRDLETTTLPAPPPRQFPAPAPAAPTATPPTPATPAPPAAVPPTPASPPGPPASASAELAADDVAGGAPFSSSTLAELYLRQGMQERAVEVYRKVLAEDPGNERARAGLAALEPLPVSAGGRADPEGERAARRRTIERTIAGLENLLDSFRRR